MRNLCWWAVPCAAAIFLAVYLLPEGLLLPAGVLCALGGLTAFFFHGKTRKKLVLTALGLSVGLLWTGLYNILFLDPTQQLICSEYQTYALVVLDFPSETARGSSFPARLRWEDGADPKIQIYASADALELQPGDIITAELRVSSSASIRGQSVDYYRAKGIYLLGYAHGETTLVSRPSQVSPRYWPKFTAKALKNSIAQVFSPDVSGFFTALITGDKSFLPTGLYAALRRAGISHVVAVSGLHISFLAGLLTTLLGKRTRLSAGVGMVLVFFFAAVAGNSPSALRASFMEAALLLAPLVGRENDKPTTLSVVLILLLLPCPYAAASVSLQLSFAAVVGIFLITGPFYTKWLKSIPKADRLWQKLLRRVLVFLFGTFATTLGALLFTTPLVAIYYHSISLVGPLTNLLTLWAVSDAFLGGLLTALLGLLSLPVGSALAWIVAWPARWVIWVSQGISRWPFASLSLLSGYLLVWFLTAYAIVLLWLVFHRGTRPAIPIGALVLTLCVALMVNAWDSITGVLTIAALDVGQGASTLLYSKGHAILVDCGGNGLDDPGDVAADYLQTLGTSRLDALILTHYHSDHANGVAELLSRLDVSLLILPDVTPEESLRQEILSLAEQYSCEVELLSDDATASFGDASLQIYAPLGDGGANEEGLSVLCTVGDYDVLLTGDMNSVVEKRLVKYKSLPDIELLMVGHHGSKNSTSEELLLATTPEYAIISSGYNTYGHPAEEALERLGAAGCGIYRTDLMGTVTFTVRGE